MNAAEYFLNEVRAEHPEWSFDRQFIEAIERSGLRGPFPKTEVVINARKSVKTSPRVTVSASGSPDDLIATVQSEHRDWSAAQVEKWVWENCWT
jgi:hypothetical protein